jgi:hypothetical protein
MISEARRVRSGLSGAAGQHVPPITDPRWPVALILLAFTLMGQLWLDFPVSAGQVLAAVVAACLAEMVLGRLVAGRVFLPLSAFITGLGLGLLLRGEGIALLALAAVLAISSKYVFRVADGHIFNPSNFGVIAGLSLPLGATVTSGQWGTLPLVMLGIAGAGFLVVRQAHRLWLTGGFAAGLALTTAALSAGGQPALANHLNAAVLLFAFFMITDPRTSPSTPTAQIVFGLSTGALGAVLWSLNVQGGIFWALAVCCAAYGILRVLSPAVPRTSPWAAFANAPGGRPRSGGGGPGDSGRISSPRGPRSGLSRGNFVKRALYGGAGLAALALGAAAVSGRGERDRLAEDLEEAREKLVFLRRSYIASGGGINLKRMPDESGEEKVEMREIFSFDRYHAMCIVETVPEAFVMPTYAMDEIKIEPNEFFMEMITTEVTGFHVKEDSETGRLVATMDGSLDCATYAATSTISIGSRTEAEKATFRIEARDTGGQELPNKTRPFEFTVFFDEEDAPVNRKIFGPEFTFTGEMISGQIAVESVEDLYPL